MTAAKHSGYVLRMLEAFRNNTKFAVENFAFANEMKVVVRMKAAFAQMNSVLINVSKQFREKYFC